MSPAVPPLPRLVADSARNTPGWPYPEPVFLRRGCAPLDNLRDRTRHPSVVRGVALFFPSPGQRTLPPRARRVARGKKRCAILHQGPESFFTLGSLFVAFELTPPEASPPPSPSKRTDPSARRCPSPTSAEPLFSPFAQVWTLANAG